jgi:formylglycine-generating enzyme required for sulfatase activity
MTAAEVISQEQLRQVTIQKVALFERQFGERYRLLAYHSALPLVLTPELVHYLRAEFLRDEVPWEAEADLLLSDLCSQVGYELYAMDTDMRAYLLEQMQQDERIAPERMQQVAQLLMSYVNYLREIHPEQRQRELQAQRWAAMAYLGEERSRQMVDEIIAEFESSGNEGNSNTVKAELARLVRITQELTVQLTNYPELLRYTAKVNQAIRQPHSMPPEELQRAYQVGDRVLRLPGSEHIQGFPPLEILSFSTAKFVEQVAPPEPSSIWPPTLQTEEYTVATIVPEAITQSDRAWPADNSTITILFLAVNPRGSTLLKSEQEVSQIRDRLNRSRYRKRFLVRYAMVARPRDLRQAILDYKPQVVHFCGHGEGERGLVLEDETGVVKLVSTKALAALFQPFSDQVKCVSLSACFSVVQAEAIARHIDWVIGMNQSIEDWAAIEFSTSFYDALGAGKSGDFAFSMGVNTMHLMGGIREEYTPVLFKKSGFQQRRGKQIFISYQPGVEPDEKVALLLYKELSLHHRVFMDQTLRERRPWEELIDSQVLQSDFFIPLLSASSVYSERVMGEIGIAMQHTILEGTPRVIPIRVAYRQELTYPMATDLNHIHSLFWDSEADTVRLVENIKREIEGEASAISSEPVNAVEPLAPPVTSRPISIELFRFIAARLEKGGLKVGPLGGGWVVKKFDGQAIRFIEQLDSNIQLDMVLIEGGTFMMGSPEDEEESSHSEKPQHLVTVPRFFLGRYPITQIQWQIVAETIPPVKIELNPRPSRFRGSQRPVEQVSWYEAEEFCARLAVKTKRPYRLPTEAEWEYACRAGTTNPFHFGETISPELANYDCSVAYANGSIGEYRVETTPVDHFKIANAWGLCDMHGNVWEWCQDHWHGDYNGTPTDGSAWLSPEKNSYRVIRGGSWGYSPWLCRSACRGNGDPVIRGYSLGLRVSCSALGIP